MRRNMNPNKISDISFTSKHVQSELFTRSNVHSSILYSWNLQLNVVASAQDHSADEDKNNPGAMSSGQQKQEKLKVKRALNFSGEKPSTSILDTINHPKHMKNLSIEVNCIIKITLMFVQAILHIFSKFSHLQNFNSYF